MEEGLKLVLLLFDRAEKKSKEQKYFSYMVFFSIWAALPFSSVSTPIKRNGDIVVKQQQQQQAVVRTVQGYT